MSAIGLPFLIFNREKLVFRNRSRVESRVLRLMCVAYHSILVLAVGVLAGCASQSAKTGLLSPVASDVYKGKQILVAVQGDETGELSRNLALAFSKVIHNQVVEDPIVYITQHYPNSVSPLRFKQKVLDGSTNLGADNIGLFIIVYESPIQHSTNRRTITAQLKNCWPLCSIRDTDQLTVIGDGGVEAVIKPNKKTGVLDVPMDVVVRFTQYTFSAYAAASFEAIDVESLQTISLSKAEKFAGINTANFEQSAYLTSQSGREKFKLEYGYPREPRQVMEEKAFFASRYKAADAALQQNIANYIASLPL